MTHGYLAVPLNKKLFPEGKAIPTMLENVKLQSITSNDRKTGLNIAALVNRF